MTEAEWLACDEPREMFSALQQVSYDRAYRMFAISAIWPYVLAHGNDRTRQVMETAEKAAAGELNRSELYDARMNVGAWATPPRGEPPAEWITRAAGLCLDLRPLNAARVVITVVPYLQSILGSGGRLTDWRRHCGPADAAESTDLRRGCSAWLAALLRETIGNPFQSTGIKRSWRTDTAVALARGMYESRDFDAMPILADALQDAGCDEPAILDHCRAEGAPHVRGCWVIDLVLGLV